jgi:phosphoglycolate phosphatase
MAKYTHLMWDFNGTIFDDAQAGIDAVNKMLAERSLPIIEGRERYREIFDFPIEEYYRGLGFDFDREPYEYLAPIWVDQYNKNAENASLCPGVKETMERVKEMGVEQSVLSAPRSRVRSKTTTASMSDSRARRSPPQRRNTECSLYGS